MASDTVIPGPANPNLAGRAEGYVCCGGDAVPGQSPVEVVGLTIDACGELAFSVTGQVSFSPGAPPGNNPDGDGDLDMTNFGDGISAPVKVRANALVGVFLGDESPTGSNTPAQLDFSSGLAFTSVAPAIGQIFFIGDGLTSDTSAGMFDGTPQSFVVPTDATGLFLGTTDGIGWFNNSGSFDVNVAEVPASPDEVCGDPAGPEGITATDALYALRAAVGTVLCRECVCDVNRSGSTVATDSLAILRHAVGQDVSLACDCCADLG
ncbi:MAG TPA: hypothetical protein VEC57_15215 [Candidatus Limnocylindrales bacterium]|nr:hypothetical protein [Candidatus Limnocylindrales bacterium]